MKSILLSILFSSSFLSFGQIPTISSLEITPEPLSDSDSILFVATVGMNTLPVYIDFITISDSGSYFIVDACYASGMLTAYGERTDTFNLGIKPPGVYDAILYAHGYCGDTIWSSKDTITFTIGYTSMSNIETNNVTIFPNPVTGEKFKVSNEVQVGSKYFIYDILGRNVKEDFIPESREIITGNLNGSYFLLIESEKGRKSVRIQIE
ncbi:MAG: T9SS type A sorting domain-containing protein [Crocinitomicaceae bacterium]|nr:T9SS type A sorting domain-containing protein [Crocinitomicaceae bacterium]